MKSLWLVMALLGQFQVEELASNNKPLLPSFTQEELSPTKKLVNEDERPTLELLGASWCGACQVAKRNLEGQTNLPFKWRYRNVDREGWLNATQIPAFAYNGRVIQYGWSNPTELMSRYRSVTKAKSVSKPTRAANQRLSSIELKEFARTYRGGTVGIQGMTAYQHLQDNRHGFTANQLQGLTEAECFKLHGAHHNGYLTPFKIGN